MNPLSNLSLIELPGHHTHRLQGPAHLRVTRGLVWVTIDGRRDDILLPAGEGMRFAPGDAVVAYALGGAASFEVMPVAAAPARPLSTWAGKVAARLRGVPLFERHA